MYNFPLFDTFWRQNVSNSGDSEGIQKMISKFMGIGFLMLEN